MCYNDITEAKMEKTMTADSKSESSEGDVTDYKAAIAEMFAEITRLEDQTRRSQMETQRLRTETREILARMKAA